MFDDRKFDDKKFSGEELDAAKFDEVSLESLMSAKVHSDKDRFTATELAALRSDLLQGSMMDSYEAAELLQVFLMGRGYGVSPKAALDAASRVEMAGCALPVLQHELENLAMVM